MNRAIFFPTSPVFPLYPDNRRIFIWRERGTRNNSAFSHESVRLGGGGVMLYADISIDRLPNIHIIRNRALAGHQFRDGILRPIAVSYGAAIGDDFILMDENCRTLRAILVNDFLLGERID